MQTLVRLDMVLLCRNNAMINMHVKTQNWVKRPWPNPTRPKSLTPWPSSISGAGHC